MLLPKSHSNHYPILISPFQSDVEFSQKPFRIKPMWFSHPTFPRLVKSCWNNSILNLDYNVKHFTREVELWNKDYFGNIFYRKKRILVRLHGIKRKLAIFLNSLMSNLQKSLQANYQENLANDEDF